MPHVLAAYEGEIKRQYERSDLRRIRANQTQELMALRPELEKLRSALKVLASPERLTRDDSGEDELEARTDFAEQVLIDTFNDGA